jgi:hypothetical protein
MSLRLRREQEGHDEPVVQSRERAVLPEREGHGDRAHSPGAVRASFIRQRFDTTDRGVSDARSTRCSGSRAGTRTRRREFAYALWGRRSRKASRARSATSTEALDVVLPRSENARFTLLWDGLSRARRLLLRACPRGRRRGGSRQATGTHTGSPAGVLRQRANEVLMAAELVGRARRRDA